MAHGEMSVDSSMPLKSHGLTEKFHGLTEKFHGLTEKRHGCILLLPQEAVHLM